MPNTRWTPALSVGAGIFCIAFTFAGSIQSPFDVVMCPMNGTSDSRKQSFCALSATPRSSQRYKKAFRLRSWSATASSCVSPYPTTTKSSAMTSILSGR